MLSLCAVAVGVRCGEREGHRPHGWEQQEATKGLLITDFRMLSSSSADVLHSRNGLRTTYLLEVVPIISAVAGCSDSPCSTSVVRRVDLKAAYGAHLAGERHEMNDAVGGVALPRSITPISAVVMLTTVSLMSSVVLPCVARCMRDQ